MMTIDQFVAYIHDELSKANRLAYARAEQNTNYFEFDALHLDLPTALFDTGGTYPTTILIQWPVQVQKQLINDLIQQLRQQVEHTMPEKASRIVEAACCSIAFSLRHFLAQYQAKWLADADAFAAVLYGYFQNLLKRLVAALNGQLERAVSSLTLADVTVVNLSRAFTVDFLAQFAKRKWLAPLSMQVKPSVCQGSVTLTIDVQST